MIIKKRKKPHSILKLQALLRRLPLHHPKIPLITEELNKRMAGYKGESSLDFPLGFLDEKNYFIFHDLRLQVYSRFFQIDTLLLSKRFVLILEVKNIAGTLYFDPEFKQLIRTKEGKEIAFPDPLVQIQRHESQLKNWFSKNGLPEVPIYSLVIISNPQSVIRTNSKNYKLSDKVIRTEVLHSKITQIESLLIKETLSEKELRRIIRLLKKQHTELDFSILERFQITKDEILIGVICEKCKHNHLLRLRGKWFCSKCQHVSKDAHIQALKDYYLLIDSTITNKQVREFLRIESSAATTRLLKTMNLTYTGINRGRVYNLYFEDE